MFLQDVCPIVSLFCTDRTTCARERNPMWGHWVLRTNCFLICFPGVPLKYDTCSQKYLLQSMRQLDQ